jgi:hypothetical protein
MNWQLEFFPLIPVQTLIAAAAIASAVALILLWRGRRGALLRVAAFALFLCALANPNLKQEEQEPLSNIAAVVVDESASQKIGQRAERTEALKTQLGKALAAIPNLETRWLTSSSGEGSSRDETTLFADLNRGLADVPPERLSGVIMITDGQVHDAPKTAQKLGSDHRPPRRARQSTASCLGAPFRPGRQRTERRAQGHRQPRGSAGQEGPSHRQA